MYYFTRIQAIQRGKIVRRERQKEMEMSSAIFVDPLAAQPERVESAKEKSLQERDEEAAAYYMTRVQAIHRGKMARQQMNQELCFHHIFRYS